jgi:glycyl-tRNA synthetase beta chain
VDDDIVRMSTRASALADLLNTPDGINLLAGFRRAANILRIEERKDGPVDELVDPNLLELREEQDLFAALEDIHPYKLIRLLGSEQFSAAMEVLASLRPKLDAFFDKVTVNDPRPELRRNRLRLLSRVRAAMHLAADFSRIDG